MTVRKQAEVGPAVRLEATAAPVLAIDGDFRIVGRNHPLEKLLGYPTGEAVGEQCWATLGGCDVFGNPYCTEFCGVRQALLRNEPVHNFEMNLPTASGGPIPTACITLLIGGGRLDQQPAIVHVFQPLVGDRERKGYVEAIHKASSGEQRALSQRQREVLDYLGQGWTNQAVARALGIGTATVRTHIQNILRKFAVHNLRQAIAVARHHNLI